MNAVLDTSAMDTSAGHPVQLATWNVNSLKVRLPHLLQWLETNPVDLLGLQELKLTDENFPTAELEAAGYGDRKSVV